MHLSAIVYHLLLYLFIWFNHNNTVSTLVLKENNTRLNGLIASQVDAKKKFIRKILQPPLAFAYNDQEEDSAKAASKKDPKESGEHLKEIGKHYDSDHHETHKEKGEKGYSSSDEKENSEHAHKDKEAHKGHYEDLGGKKKKSSDDHKYQNKKHKYKDFGKFKKFDENGTHKKGHHTHGSHIIRKKDHYVKNYEFFDEDLGDEDHEKFGEFHENRSFKKGKTEKTSSTKGNHHQDEYGKKGHTEKGGQFYKKKEHKKDSGRDAYGEQKKKYGKENHKKSKKDWNYYHGQPKKSDSHGSGSNINAETFDNFTVIKPKYKLKGNIKKVNSKPLKTKSAFDMLTDLMEGF